MSKLVPSDIYPLPGVLWITYPNADKLWKTFWRLQEYYQSKKFKGEVFTDEEFKVWYESYFKESFSQYGDRWVGFNMPTYVMDSFWTKFDRTKEEEQLFKRIRNSKKPTHYVIATKRQDGVSIQHELAHALWHISPLYKQRALEILKKLPREDGIKLITVLRKMSYHDVVIEDEVQAYILTSLVQDVGESGFDKYRQHADALKQVYNFVLKQVTKSDKYCI